MKCKIFSFAALICLLFGATNELAAQRYQPAKTSAYKSSMRHFKRSDKFSLMGGVGLAAMNSDNRTGGWSDGLGNILRQNGAGPELGIGAMYQVSRFVALRGNLNYVGFNSDLMEDRPGLQEPFSANMVEVSGSVVVNLLDYYLPSRGHSSAGMRRLLVPYVRGGVGLLYYSSSTPESKSSGLTTVIPVGGGIRINYSNRLSFAPEMTLNFTGTDYLDNFERSSGITGDNDAYLSASLKVLYTLSSKNRYSFRRGR